MLAGQSGPHDEDVQIPKLGDRKDVLRCAAGGIRGLAEENLRSAGFPLRGPGAESCRGRKPAILRRRRDQNTRRLGSRFLRNKREQAKGSENLNDETSSSHICLRSAELERIPENDPDF